MPTTTQNLCYNCFQHIEDPAAPCPYCGFDLAENAGKFPVALQAGTVLNDRYIVGRVLGQGGFGITYLAFDTQIQAKVAVKEYMPGELAARVDGTTVSVFAGTKTDDFTYGAERFQEEARTLAKFIGHPNIAGVSSYFDENNTSYFVMDYIEGVSFKSYIANNGGKVSVDEALNVMIPVLRALTAVHAEGFIHRDVTPDNIYISKDGNVKLLDFGSARYSIGDKSKSLDVILKVGYAPKEQYIRRGRQGPYTDVYSCAACFYAALTGVLPPESLERLDHDELVPVSQAGIDIPEWLDRAILKGLAVQPEDRFQSAAEFLDAIENQIAVEVPAPSAPVQPEKKNPQTALIAGIAAALAVVLGVGIFLGSRGGGESGAPTPNNENVIAAGKPDVPPEEQSAPEDDGPKVMIAGKEYSPAATELDLGEVRLSEEDFETLKTLTGLKSLKLVMDNIPDFQWLTNLTNLEELSISGTGQTYADMDFLSQLTKLKSLKMPPLLKGLPSLDISALSELTELTSLEIPRTVKDLTPIQNLTKLEALIVINGYPPDDGGYDTLEPLRYLTNLTKLKILKDDRKGPVDIAPLEGLSKMQTLSIQVERMSGLTDRGLSNLSALAGMKDLKSLELVTYGLTDISPLQYLKNLEIVSITDMSDGTMGIINNINDWSPVDHVPTVIGRD